MKKFPLLTLALAAFINHKLLVAQDRKVQMGIEPFFNIEIPGSTNYSSEDYTRYVIGLGYILEYPTSKVNKHWKWNTGLYYYYLHSALTSKLSTTLIPCDIPVFLLGDTYVQARKTFNSHNLRLPLKISYDAGDLSFSGGILLGLQLTNRQRVKVILHPEDACDDYPQTGTPITGEEFKSWIYHDRFSFGPEIGVGYGFDVGTKLRLIPGFVYNLMLYPYKAATNNDRYVDSYHMIGVNCKVIFLKK